MTRRVAVGAVLALIVTFVAVQWACGPRLDEQQVRARLVDVLQLRDDQLRIRAISGDRSPIATIEYGGVATRLRFRQQEGVWVIEAVERRGQWEPADRAVPVLARDLKERARARQMEEVMPRYARTLKLLVGWSALLSADCKAGLPLSRSALLDLHGTWHRALFKNRGGEFHNADLFLRDAWWKELHVAYSAARIDVQSGGADGRLETADDIRLAYTRTLLQRGTELCLPQIALPSFVADAIGRQDAPPAWNCADLLDALQRAGRLEVVP